MMNVVALMAFMILFNEMFSVFLILDGDRCETFIGLCGEIDDDAAEQGTHTNSRSVYTKIGTASGVRNHKFVLMIA
jgi:hypothetical protein